MRATRSVLAFALLLVSLSLYAKAQALRSARVIAEKANLRETPSFQALAEGEVTVGTIVKILDEKLPWYAVRVGDRLGWMHGASLQFVSTSEHQQGPIRLTTSPDLAPPEPRTPKEPTSQPNRGGGYIRGPRGGCYYIGGSGRKVYVDRGLCN